MIRLFIGVILLNFSTPVVYSQDLSLTDLYKSNTLQSIEHLRGLGLDKVNCSARLEKRDCLSLKDLKEQIERNEIRFIELPQFHSSPVSTRATAFYVPARKTVYLNALAEHDLSHSGELGLHEAMGAAGYPEINFEHSISAYLLRKKIDTTSIREVNYHLGTMQRPARKSGDTVIDRANSALSLGGTTVIGGGGDSRAFKQRVLLIDYLTSHPWLKSHHSPSMAFSQALMPIEVSDTIGDIQFIFEGDSYWPKHIVLPGKTIALAPLNDIHAPNRALEEVIFYLESVLPGSFAHVRTIEMQNYVCIRTSANAGGPHKLYATFPKDPSKVHPLAMERKYERKWMSGCKSGEWVKDRGRTP